MEALQTDDGRIYYVGPQGQLATIKPTDVQKHKAKVGWRLAVQADIDAKVKAEADRKAAEAPAPIE